MAVELQRIVYGAFRELYDTTEYFWESRQLDNLRYLESYGVDDTIWEILLTAYPQCFEDGRTISGSFVDEIRNTELAMKNIAIDWRVYDRTFDLKFQELDSFVDAMVVAMESIERFTPNYSI